MYILYFTLYFRRFKKNCIFTIFYLRLGLSIFIFKIKCLFFQPLLITGKILSIKLPGISKYY